MLVSDCIKYDCSLLASFALLIFVMYRYCAGLISSSSLRQVLPVTQLLQSDPLEADSRPSSRNITEQDVCQEASETTKMPTKPRHHVQTEKLCECSTVAAEEMTQQTDVYDWYGSLVTAQMGFHHDSSTPPQSLNGDSESQVFLFSNMPVVIKTFYHIYIVVCYM